jgi:hypothetical protein
MSNALRIKRRLSPGAAGAPSSLANAELAFNEVDLTLYYGFGTGGAGGSASNVIPIGGSGAFLTLSGDQTASGNKTLNGTIDVTGGVLKAATQASSDNSTKVATTAYVKSQGYGPGTVTTLSVVSANGFAGTVANDTSTPAITITTSATGLLKGSSGSLAAASGSDINTAFGSQTANYVYAAPNASNGNPTFRALLAADISNLSSQSLTLFSAPTADLSVGGYKLTNVANPVNANDAVNKYYVDTYATGLDIKQSVRAASTDNLSVTYNATGGTSGRGQITGAPNSLDGIALAAGNRILLKDQTASAQNGIWVVTTLGTGANGVWDRATDFDQDAEVTSGAFTFIEEGSVQTGQGWVLTTANPITVGGSAGTALSFTQFSGAGQIITGTGIAKSGNTLSLASGVVTAGTYRSVNVDTYGRVIGGSNPTTLSGYGITDAQPTITTTGLLKGAGGGTLSTAVAGTDYLDPSSTIDCGTF